MTAVSKTAIVLTLGATIAISTGCESTEDIMPPVVVHTPLSLDPTETIELGGWWSNGGLMLRLGRDAQYELYEGLNRYQPPRERGRWSQSSYAVLWLEPYESRAPERVRVAIGRVGDQLRLTRPGLSAMVSIEGPPEVLEDRLIDRWSGPAGTLELTADMRYTFQPDRRPGHATASVGHSGRWELAEQTVILIPRSPNLGPFRLDVAQREEDAILLESDEAAYERYVPEDKPLAGLSRSPHA